MLITMIMTLITMMMMVLIRTKLMLITTKMMWRLRTTWKYSSSSTSVPSSSRTSKQWFPIEPFGISFGIGFVICQFTIFSISPCRAPPRRCSQGNPDLWSFFFNFFSLRTLSFPEQPRLRCFSSPIIFPNSLFNFPILLHRPSVQFNHGHFPSQSIQFLNI